MKKIFNVPYNRVNWVTFVFLLGTLTLALTAAPWYLFKYGMDWFLFGWFMFYTFATGMSITLGYHRLLSHLSFKAKWPVKLFILLFGAAAFENSALDWVSDHRIHHKHVDHDDDPYNISLGFFHAHIGWMLFKLRPEPPMDNVADLEKDALVMWQHRWVHWVGFLLGFITPSILGYMHNGLVGALGGLLIVGVLRTVFVQHSTFFINSLCHYVGRQPYSTRCSARDSAMMAIFTFGEGYHNYHHEFQHDYRNGVKFWQWDPTKWMIWLLSKLGLASNLRRVPDAKIYLAEMNEARRQIEQGIKSYSEAVPESSWKHIESYVTSLQSISQKMLERCKNIQEQTQNRIDTVSREMVQEFKREIRTAKMNLEAMKRTYASLKDDNICSKA